MDYGIGMFLAGLVSGAGYSIDASLHDYSRQINAKVEGTSNPQHQSQCWDSRMSFLSPEAAVSQTAYPWVR